MLPIRLKIKGLYSYKSEQNIDFTSLIEGQLFGIFGAVGSGKTAILEAITLALFNQSERLGGRDDRAYNIMNLQSTELVIEFEFEEKGSQYLFTVSGKRSKKYFEKVTVKRQAYQLKGNDYEPLKEGISAEGIVGLSYANFKRTVIIPQGKFQDFIQLTGTDRTRMLKELFHLHQFELDRKTKILSDENKTSVAVLEGKLSGYIEYSKEILKKEQEELTSVKKACDELAKAVSLLEKEKNNLEKLIDLTQKVKTNKEDLVELEKQKERIAQLEKELKEYQIYYSRYAILLTEFDRINKACEQSLLLENALKEDQEHLFPLLENTKKEFTTLSKEVEEHPELERQLEALQVAQEIQKKQRDLEQLKQRQESGQGYVNTQQEKVLAIEIRLKQQVVKLKSNYFDLLKSGAYEFWFELSSNIKLNEENESLLQTKLNELTTFIKQKEAMLLSLLGDCTSEKDITIRIKALETSEGTTKKAIEKLKIAVGLATYTAHLKDGEDCPVCGSKEHPKQGMHHVDEDKLIVLEKELVTNSAHQNQLKTSLVSYKLENQVLIDKKKEKEITKQELNKNKEKGVSLFQLALDKDEQIKNTSLVHKQLTVVKTLKKEQEGAISKREELQVGLSEQEKRLNKYKEAVQGFEKEGVGLETELKVLNKGFSFPKYLKNTLEQTENQTRKIKDKIANSIRLFKDTEKELKKLELDKVALTTKLELETKHRVLLKEEFVVVNLSIESLLSADKTKLEQVKTVLSKSLDIEQSTKRIQVYTSSVSAVKATITTLEKELGGKYVDENEYLECLEKFNLSYSNLEDLKENRTEKQSKVKEVEQKLNEQKELYVQQEKLLVRADLLKIFTGLFRNSGFVNYASGVKLHELCNEANKRFYPLTKQRMRLEINEDNNFYVRDFYNNGQLRSVKTLSGGQTFQASLCLALALAEMIQVQSGSNQNFFFLDEGFGTLDPESLALVFETLKSLRKEGRVVGVISHVEELKDEIDRFLLIDNNSGESMISCSWKK